MNHYTVNVNNILKRFGRHVVFQNIYFTHSDGVLGIAGPNGSGKSTLLKCMAGLCAPTKGSVEWIDNEQSITNEQFKRRLGYAAPYINLYNELSCKENLAFLLELRNHSNRKERMRSVLERTAMDAFTDQPFGRLSTGQQQRMRLAASLVHQPDILFLDEPGSNLDDEGQKLIQTSVSEFKESGRLVIIASNNRDELHLCDEVYSVEEERYLEK